MNTSKRTTGLGRGLSALMGDDDQVISPAGALHGEKRVPIHKLSANPFQPRRGFDSDRIAELAASIREKGLLQPILVRPAKTSDEFEIIAGERRWRAAQAAGLHEVPVVVRAMDDTEALELAIVENVQRQDLTAIEEANGYRKLIEEFGHTQEEVSQAVGKSRSHLANTLRLLTLPEQILDWIESGKLTPGHARTLVGRDDALELAERIIRRRLNVRQAEKLVRSRKAGPRKASQAEPAKDADTRALERELADSLGLKVSIDHGGQKGRITIDYQTLEQLDDLCRRLSG